MNLLFDENLPPVVVKALQALQPNIPFDVYHVLEVLGKGTPDVDIYAFIQQQPGDWFFVSHDKAMNRNKHERAAMHRSGAGVFIFSGRTSRDVVQSMQFVLSRLPEMERVARRHKRPFVFSVPDRGQLRRL